jgi:hypothetical protein
VSPTQNTRRRNQASNHHRDNVTPLAPDRR